MAPRLPLYKYYSVIYNLSPCHARSLGEGVLAGQMRAEDSKRLDLLRAQQDKTHRRIQQLTQAGVYTSFIELSKAYCDELCERNKWKKLDDTPERGGDTRTYSARIAECDEALKELACL